MSTITDVAGRAGVTRSVVSRLLNGDPTLRIRPETEARIREAVRELQYTPNASARALRLAKSGAIGLVVHDIVNPVYGAIVNGAQQAASRAGYVVLLVEADQLEWRPDTLRNLVTDGRIDGLLIQRAGMSEDATIDRLVNQRIPIVLLNDWSYGPYSAVSLDDVRAGRLATQHLLGLGHLRIAHMAGTPSHRAEQRRFGYEQSLRDAGVRLRSSWVTVGGWDVDTGRAGMERLLRLRSRPTAVVVANVLAAIGALAAAQASGIVVPDDLSIVAIHDSWVAGYVVPPLTTVRLPLAEMGRQAVELLLEQVSGAEPRTITVTEPPPTLVVRASTGPPPTAVRDVGKRTDMQEAK